MGDLWKPDTRKKRKNGKQKKKNKRKNKEWKNGGIL